MDEPRAWARWWRIEGFAQMRDLVWEYRDPLGLKGVAPPDEYDGYLPVIASKLRRSTGRDDLVEYLVTAILDATMS